MEYEDLMLLATDVVSTREGGKKRVRFDIAVPRSPDGEIISAVPSAYDVSEMRERLRGWERRDLAWADVIALGEWLGSLLFPPPVRERLLAGLVKVKALNKGLRIRLLLEKCLQDIPWEYVLVNRAGHENTPTDFLALTPYVSLVRHEAATLSAFEVKAEGPGPVRMAVAMASPSGYRRLRLDKERRAIEHALQGNDRVQAHFARATPGTLLPEGGPVHLFHFAGHGDFERHPGARPGMTEGEGVLILDDGAGDPVSLDAAALAQRLREVGVRAAVLGACRSGRRGGVNVWSSVATALLKAELGAVVGMQYTIRDDSAIAFSRAFYRDLLAGLSVDEAVTKGRQAIAREDVRGWGVPVLYLRVEDGVIFPEYAGQDLYAIPRMPAPQQAPLIGRSADLAEVEDGIPGSRFYFYGTYGVGKTSLTAEAFNRAVRKGTFEHGHLWLKVPGMDAEVVLGEVAKEISPQQEGDVSQAQNDAAKINALRRLLARRDSLLIGLDEVAPVAARALLEAAGDCTVLLNGSDPVNLGGRAQQRPVRRLEPAEARQLFVGLAGLSEVNADEEGWVRRICEGMGRLPLAIKLAALEYADTGQSLESLWEQLQYAPRTMIPQHEEVSVIFGRVYQRLSDEPPAEGLLRRLACFPALEAPETVLRADLGRRDFFRARKHLDRLGLLDPVGPNRLGLHPLLGRLARETLEDEASAQFEEERRAVADWLLRYAADHCDDYDSLEGERCNLLGLLDWLADDGEQEALVALTRHLFDYLRVRGHWQEARRRLDVALQAAADLGNASNQAWVHLHRAILLTLQGAYGSAAGDLDAAEALYEGMEDRVGRGQVHYRRAILRALRGERSTAREQLEEALALMGGQAPAEDLAGGLERLATIVAEQGDPDQARARYGEALEISARAGDREGQLRVLGALGHLERQAGHYDLARGHYRRAVELAEDLGHVRQAAALKVEWGHLFYYQGRYDEALVHYQGAMSDFLRLQDRRGRAETEHALGNAALAQGNLEAAREHYQEALKVNRAESNPLGVAHNQYQLGLVAQRRGQLEGAAALYAGALEVAEAEERRDLKLVAPCCHQLGRLALAKGELEQASEYAERALRLARQVEHRLTEVAALCLTGLIQVQAGEPIQALQNLQSARDGFAALNAPEQVQVGEMIEELDRRIGEQAREAGDAMPRIGLVPGVDVVIEGIGDAKYLPGVDVVVEGIQDIKLVPGVDVILEGGRTIRLAVVEEEGIVSKGGGRRLIHLARGGPEIGGVRGLPRRIDPKHFLTTGDAEQADWKRRLLGGRDLISGGGGLDGLIKGGPSLGPDFDL